MTDEYQIARDAVVNAARQLHKAHDAWAGGLLNGDALFQAALTWLFIAVANLEATSGPHADGER